MNQHTSIYCVLGVLLHIFSKNIFAICVNDHTTSANLNSILLKCHTNRKSDKSCESQLMINIQISPTFKVNKLEKYLVLDEAFEPIKQSIVKIMSPYLIVISRGEPIIMYPLQYAKTINVDDNMKYPTNITKCPRNISTSKEIKSQERLYPRDNSDIVSENTRKQRQTEQRSKSLSPMELTKETKDFPWRRSNALNENKFGADISKTAKGANENILSKMGLIRILEAPQYDSTIMPELKYMYADQKTQEDGLQTEKNAEHFNDKGNTNQSLLNDQYLLNDQTLFLNGTSNIKYDIASTEVEEMNIKPKPDKVKKKKSKIQTKKEWLTDYYEPLNEPNVYSKPVDQFNEPQMYDKQVHHIHNPKMYGKPVAIKNKKSKINREKEWMHEYYDQDRFSDPLWPTTEDRWSPSRMDSISSAGESLSKNAYTENAISSEKGMRSKYTLSKYGLSKNDMDSYDLPVLPPYSKTNRFNSLDTNENFEYDFKHPEEELFDVNTKYPGSLFSNPYSKNNIKRRYNAMPSYQNNPMRKRRKRNALDYEFSNLEDNLYMRDNDISPCDTCGGKNKKTGGGKPGFVLNSINPSNGNDIIFENVQTRDHDAVPCDTCGGKNKKPGGKTLPSLNTENLQKIQESINENPCNCYEENIQGNNIKSGHHSCICLTNSEFCNCDSSKSTRALGKTCKTSSSYSIYNMSTPLPFLKTNVRIFRKRHKTWWRIAPSITLNSLAGIFVNGNLSVLFSTHVDILELDKSLYLQNHKLVVPKCEKACAKQTKPEENYDLKCLDDSLENAFLFDCSERDITQLDIQKSLQSKHKKELNKNVNGIKGIADLGYFPTSLNALQKCPNNDQRLCLNVLDDKVPAFNVKIKMPFRENAVIVSNIYKAKISRIVTDTTTKDALQISVDVTNKGLEANEFSINLSDCPLSDISSTKTNARKVLLPHIGDTITFLLPFTIVSKKNQKFKCDVIVKAVDKASFPESEEGHSGERIVARRSMDIQTHGRCFCVWRCECHCIDKLETHVNFNVCKKMGYSAERKAGLLLNCPPGEEEHDECLMDNDTVDENDDCGLFCQIIRFTIALLIILVLLGFLKAILGVCFKSIDWFGFDSVQPGRSYACTSLARRFIVNIFFFIILIFAFWCKCFKPRKEDLMVASTEWYCNPEYNSESDTKTGKRTKSSSRISGGSDQIHNVPELIMDPFEPHYDNELSEDEIECEKSTVYILHMLEESKQSLTSMLTTRQNEEKLKNQCIEDAPIVMNLSVTDEFVDKLICAQIVYRAMDTPEGGLIKIPPYYRYCVQGFFLRSQGLTYEFVNYHPFTQHFIVSDESHELEQLSSPIYLYTNAFSRIYDSKDGVFEAGDLSIEPPNGVPCINIAQCNLLESSLCKLTTQQELQEDLKELSDLDDN